MKRPAPPDLRLEGDRKRVILEALRLHPRILWASNILAGKVRVRGGWFVGAPAGSPDLVGGLRVGARVELFGVEVKSATGELRKKQEETRDAWERAGAHYVVATTVEEALQGLGLIH